MPLQRSFRGLSDHVGSYQGGSLNFELAGAISPVVSAEQFINPYEVITNSSTLTASGQAGVIPAVPDGEFWRVRYLGFNSNAASAPVTWQPVYSHDSVLYGLVTDTLLTGTSITPGNTGYGGVSFPAEGHLMLPGDEIGWSLKSFAGAGNVDLDTIIHRQRIKF